MKVRISRLSVAVAIAFSPLTVSAEDIAATPAALMEGVGGQERINASGKLRMLSQRIPAAACHMVAGVDTERAHGVVQTASAEFETILRALEFGDDAMNIPGAETRPQTLAKISELRDAWTPMKASVSDILAGTDARQALEDSVAQSPIVLNIAQSLVSEIVGEYSNPAELVQADSFLIDLAGRQRMLLQKISKQSCLASLDGADPTAVEDMMATMQTFGTSLEALRHGMPALGVRKPPTPEIYAKLEAINVDWLALQPALTTIAEGTALDAAAAAQKFQALDALMANMDATVKLYVEATKRRS